MTDSKELTQKTLSRLRQLANGNGIAPESITLIESQEQIYKVTGKITLSLQCDIKTSVTTGRIKGKGLKIAASFTELQNEIQQIQTSFQKEGGWLDLALEELKRTPGHGWGQEGGFLSWSNQAIKLAASQNCPVCNGTAQHPCHDCKGLGQIICDFCAGRGQEICIRCGGAGRDPQNPQTPCILCHGTNFSLCRYCQGAGKTACITCQGRGHSPCQDCKGSGFVSQEATITQGARLDFSHGSASGLPSGILRGISRIGDDKLAKGHADITMNYVPPEKKTPSEVAIVDLEAKIPYADLKIKFGSKAALVSVFGKQAKMSGVPLYLDSALEPSIKALAAASKGQGSRDEAMKTRAMNEAFALVLQGKTHPNYLRQLYPVGLSADTAAEIMKNIGLLLKRDTANMRIFVSIACFLASMAFFGGLFLTPLLATLTENLSSIGKMTILVLVPVLPVGASWAALLYASRWILKNKYPDTKISASQSIGSRGAATLIAIIIAYVALLFVLRVI